MPDQAWRDRCARAMGWVQNKSKNPSQNARYWEDSSGDWVEPMSSWAPDEDYDHAMMMRDKCEELGLGISFVRGVVALYAESQAYDPVTGAQREYCAAFATAEQIAESALTVLEAAR